MIRSLETIIREDYDNNPVFLYRAKHAGLTRSPLRKANWMLWKILRDRGMLNQILTAKVSYGRNSLKYYHEHFEGDSPYQVRMKDPSFYNRLRNDGNLRFLPRRNRSDVQRERSPYGVDALAYYKKHFNGYSPYELEKEAPGLYERLLNDGLIKYLPRLRKPRRSSRGKSFRISWK